MEIIYKLLCISFFGGIVVNLLRKSEPGMALSFISAIAVFSACLLLTAFLSIKKELYVRLEEYGQLSSLYECMLKITGCSLITEISSKLCLDAGMQTEAYLVKCGGTLAGITIALPVYRQFLSFLQNLIT